MHELVKIGLQKFAVCVGVLGTRGLLSGGVGLGIISFDSVGVWSTRRCT